MKNLIQIFMTVSILIVISCSKTGSQGPAGANGTDGNANVKIFNFPSHDFAASASEFLELPTSTDSANNSAWLCYLVWANLNTYSVPGPGYNAVSTYRYYAATSSATITSFTVSKVAGAGEVYTATRIVRIYASGLQKNGSATGRQKPWSSLTELEKAQRLYPNVNFADYNAVKKAFHLKD